MPDAPPPISQATNDELAIAAILTLILFIIFEMAQVLIAIIYFLNLAITYNTKSPNWNTYLAWQAVLMMAWIVTLGMVIGKIRVIKNNTPISARRLILPIGTMLVITYAIKTSFLFYYVMSI